MYKNTIMKDEPDVYMRTSRTTLLELSMLFPFMNSKTFLNWTTVFWKFTLHCLNSSA